MLACACFNCVYLVLVSVCCVIYIVLFIAVAIVRLADVDVVRRGVVVELLVPLLHEVPLCVYIYIYIYTYIHTHVCIYMIIS